MRARPVEDLDPTATLAENARRIVRVRIDELYSFAPGALDGDAKTLHDMRIAAKRLRYVLELTAFCFGPYAAKALRRARDLQDLIGAIHDCDVLEPRVHRHIAAMRDADAQALALAGLRRGGSGDDCSPTRTPPTRQAAYGALEALAIDQRARRGILFERFRRRWRGLERAGFRERLLGALDEPPQREGA